MGDRQGWPAVIDKEFFTAFIVLPHRQVVSGPPPLVATAKAAIPTLPLGTVQSLLPQQHQGDALAL